MSLSLGENLSPLPVSTSRHRVVYSQRLLASHETSFDHSVLGTTPCMAPPSRRKLPPLSIVRRASPSESMGGVYGVAVAGAVAEGPPTGTVTEPALSVGALGAGALGGGAAATGAPVAVAVGSLKTG